MTFPWSCTSTRTWPPSQRSSSTTGPTAHRRPPRGLLVPDTDPDGRCRGHDPRARTVLERLGFNPFFIGDEVYWRVTPENPNPAGPSSPPRRRSAASSSSTPLRRTSSTTEIRIGCSVRRRISPAIQGPPTSSPTSDISSTSTARRPTGGCRSFLTSLRDSTTVASAFDEPPGPAPTVAGRRRSGLDVGPPLPLRGDPRGLPNPPHGDGDVMERLERGHRY